MRQMCDGRRAWRLLASASLIGALVAVAAPASAQSLEGSFERTLSVSGTVDLEVSTGSGSITVQPGPAGSLRVIGRIRIGRSWMGVGQSAEERLRYVESHPPIEQTGNLIRVGRVDDSEMFENVSISYEITVPAECRLRSRSGSGSQTIGDIAGPVEASAGSGHLTIGQIGGRVHASTGSGGIEAASVRGDLEARTGSGSVQVGTVRGAIDVSTGSGSIDVTQSATGEVKISAASGGVRLHGVQGPVSVTSASGSVLVQGTPAGDWQISCASGSITVEVPDTAAFDLDAHSNSGHIDSVHPVTVVGTIERRSMVGKVRGGGPLIRLRASSGRIRIG